MIGQPSTLAVNGVDGSTGSLLVKGCTVAHAADWARGARSTGSELDAMKLRVQEAQHKLGFGSWNEEDLAVCGWGILCPCDAPHRWLEALEPLLRLRREQAGPRYREYTGEQGYVPGDTATGWLRRAPRHQGLGRAHPDRVPYHLLIVGAPDVVPFRFQYELGMNYSVGRLDLSQADHLRRYAESAAAFEARAFERPRAMLYGVRNRGDLATQLSSERLVDPLAEALRPRIAVAEDLIKVEPARATKSALQQLYSAVQSRATLLFTASHGIGFPAGHERQTSDQGGIVCDEWPGEFAPAGPVSPEQYFAASDLGERDLEGLVSFHFGCYTAGTPQIDSSPLAGPGRILADKPFVSPLAQAQLARGALAVIGHVDRAWSCSFVSPGVVEDHGAFQESLTEILGGSRIGPAMAAFRLRHADVSIRLNSALEDERLGARCDDTELASLWTNENDARAYVVLGDPAVRFGERTEPHAATGE